MDDATRIVVDEEGRQVERRLGVVKAVRQIKFDGVIYKPGDFITNIEICRFIDDDSRPLSFIERPLPIGSPFVDSGDDNYFVNQSIDNVQYWVELSPLEMLAHCLIDANDL